jgi:hypothetical protein
VLKLDYEEVTVVKVESTDPDIQEFILAGINEKSGSSASRTTYSAPEVSKPFLVRVASVANPDRFNVEELGEIWPDRNAPFRKQPR